MAGHYIFWLVSLYDLSLSTFSLPHCATHCLSPHHFRSDLVLSSTLLCQACELGIVTQWSMSHVQFKIYWHYIALFVEYSGTRMQVSLTISFIVLSLLQFRLVSANWCMVDSSCEALERDVLVGCSYKYSVARTTRTESKDDNCLQWHIYLHHYLLR